VTEQGSNRQLREAQVSRDTRERVPQRSRIPFIPVASGVDRHSWQAIAPPENPRPAENKCEGIAESEILNPHRTRVTIAKASGRMHRTRNSARSILFCKVLFYLGILTALSVMCRLVSSAAIGLGSKMVARCSVYVR
jgi:hypothetical protein